MVHSRQTHKWERLAEGTPHGCSRLVTASHGSSNAEGLSEWGMWGWVTKAIDHALISLQQGKASPAKADKTSPQGHTALPATSTMSLLSWVLSPTYGRQTFKPIRYFPLRQSAPPFTVGLSSSTSLYALHGLDSNWIAHYWETTDTLWRQFDKKKRLNFFTVHLKGLYVFIITGVQKNMTTFLYLATAIQALAAQHFNITEVLTGLMWQCLWKQLNGTAAMLIGQLLFCLELPCWLVSYRTAWKAFSLVS